MNPDVNRLKKRVRQSRVKTRVRCLDCDRVVMTTDIGHMKRCACGNIELWQHPDGVEILHKNNDYQILEVVY